MKPIWQRITQGLMLIGGIWICWNLWVASPVSASLSQQQEAPQQILYQSRATLQDTQGHSWQVILFKRIRADGSATLQLRLVGFPGIPGPQHPRDLTVTTSIGQLFTAADLTASVGESFAQLSNVGQYDMVAVVPQLRPEIPTHLVLVGSDQQPITLLLSPLLVEEWQTLAFHA
jgi:hypothetical protein